MNVNKQNNKKDYLLFFDYSVKAINNNSNLKILDISFIIL